MRWRTANNRRNHPKQQCRRNGHIECWGYGHAFGGGLGTYHFCGRCGELFGKVPDNESEE